MLSVAEARGRLTLVSDGNYQARLTLMATIGRGHRRDAAASWPPTPPLANTASPPYYADPRRERRHRRDAVAKYTPTFTAVPGGGRVWPHPGRQNRMAQTTRDAAGPRSSAAAKTGSPQLADLLYLAAATMSTRCFIGYAPAGDPQIAVARR